METEATTNWQPIIIALTPVLIAGLKMLIPKIPKALLPIVAPLLGVAADIAGNYAGLWAGNVLVGAVLGAAGVGLREGYDQILKSMPKAKVPGPTLIAGLCIVGLSVGCARFSTKQTDISYDDNGNKQRQVTTKASAYTVWQAQSALANWKATQTDDSQGAEVGSLAQETAGGTNVVMALQNILAIVEAVK